uniref:Uncharacterized protein n=1 Tax=Solanum lycopersicum TaxID=4081 RepID=A0A3Q7EXX1_SOLLC
MEQYQLIDLVERVETIEEVELEHDNIRIEREDIDGASVDAPLNNEEEADLKKRKGRGKTTGLSTQKKRKENDSGKLKAIVQMT